jgi:sporulation-control protein spo0M
MVFGLGKGKIDVILEKTDFKHGEVIRGKINLELKKPVQAKELKISFIGQKDINRVGGGTSRGIIYQTDKSLGGESEYSSNIYPFELKIPEDILEQARNWKNKWYSGIALKAFERMEEKGKVSNIFFIETSLDISKSIDLTKKVKINIL